MASQAAAMTRASSVDSSIQVRQMLLDEESSVPASTPPTSLADTSSVASVKDTNAPSHTTTTMITDEVESSGGRRARRVRTSVNYNLVELSNAQVTTSANASRNVSGLTGRTLVSASEEDDAATPFEQNVEKAMNMEWEIPEDLPPRTEPGTIQRKPSVKDRVKKAAGKVSSALGKRSREVMEAGKRKVGQLKGGNEKHNKYLKELDMGVKGVLDEMDFDDDDDDDEEQKRPAKKARKEKAAPAVKPMAPPLVKATSASGIVTAKKGKRWQKEGLYVGQSADSDGTQHGSKKLQKKRPSSSGSGASQETEAPPAKRRSMMPMPMFGYLKDDKQVDFKIPYDVFAPSFKKGDAKPKDWTDRPNRQNRIVGDAREIWYKKGSLGQSLCICQPPADGEQGCDYDCLNRAMHYECNENNCSLNGVGCSNRPFAQLAARIKKGGRYDIGVEVIKTSNRGFGVRACRTFAPGEIIMEYTGEIITEYECERRMAEVYNKSDNYYLMQFDRGLVIDGTKGSMGRFVNHSCAPNCEVRMMRGADDRPHMGIFAGDDGVMTGEELTYDYNFDNFGSSQQTCHCGAPSCRGFLSKRLNAAEQKLRDKEEKERQLKAAEEAMRNAEATMQAKKEKSEKPGWTGWADLNSKEVREQLKREKQEREEAAKNSERARRMAARRGEVVPPLPKTEEPTPKQPAETKKPARYDSRRNTSGDTVKTQKSTIRKVPTSESSLAAKASASARADSSSTPKPKHKRTNSALSATGSRFREAVSASRRGRTTSTSSATAMLLERASSVASDDDDDDDDDVGEAIAGAAPVNGVADYDVEHETAAPTKADKGKKRKLGNVLKEVAGAVGIGRGNKRQTAAGAGAEASSSSSKDNNNRTPGKLRQSTLSFSKLMQ
ncbi:hypothetical protein Q7P37_006204 [Cladosporium fusiforme]